MIVYLITNNLNGKMYVGQTIHTLEKRFGQHLQDSRRGSKYPFHLALKKYGKESFLMKVICECSSHDELNQKEIHYIKTLNTRHGGYNLTDGGQGVRGKGIWNHSEESKRKISKGNSGKVRTKEVKDRIRESVLKVMTDDHKKLISKRTKKALNTPGRKALAEIRVAKLRKKIQQFTLSGKLIATYRSAREASNQTGVNHGNMCSVARSNCGHAGGFIWRYVDAA